MSFVSLLLARTENHANLFRNETGFPWYCFHNVFAKWIHFFCFQGALYHRLLTQDASVTGRSDFLYIEKYFFMNRHIENRWLCKYLLIHWLSSHKSKKLASEYFLQKSNYVFFVSDHLLNGNLIFFSEFLRSHFVLHFLQSFTDLCLTINYIKITISISEKND